MHEKKEIPSGKLRGTETILLVDDEDMILDPGAQMLRELGYNVLIARSGFEAVCIYEEHIDRIDMVVLDIIMPGMGGEETFYKLRDINPKLKILLASGYSREDKATQLLNHGCDGFIQKPFNTLELSHKIREIIDKKRVR
ncbi:MAG: response regulator [Syntrophales bacterium]|jgi:CheY-like chemotaxis protein